LLKTYNFALIL